MKVLIIENDFNKKHKMWQLLCLASSNCLDMDFTRGETEANNGDKMEEFASISLNLDDSKDVNQFQTFLHFWMEHEVTAKGEDDDDV
jgi:hypothetical protein